MVDGGIPSILCPGEPVIAPLTYPPPRKESRYNTSLKGQKGADKWSETFDSEVGHLRIELCVSLCNKGTVLS